MIEIGSLVDGKYKVLHKIGQGGMSVVYLAINEKANKQWAIKEVRKEGVKDFSVVKQSLIAEIELLKKLNHPYLPSIVDVIETEGTFLVVMDYIEGCPLSTILKERGVQSQDNVIEWAKQLCEVLIYLHSRTPAIIYRDMKPSNIMLKPDGTITLIDFGTAREFKAKNDADTTCLGTRGYAAPEQFGGQGQTDERTDIYSLGATLYHLVTGHNPSTPPFELKPIRQWNSCLSTGLEKIITKCIQNNPEQRYQSCVHMLYELNHINEIDGKYKKRQKKRLCMFLCFAVIACIGFGCSFMSYRHSVHLREVDYNNVMEMAKVSKDQSARIQYWKTAICINPQNEKGYMSLIQEYYEDCEFTEEEEFEIITLLQSFYNHSDTTYLECLKENEKGYGQFCYSLGNLYWYYYIDKGNKHKQAATWFEDAIQYGKLSESDYRKAELFYEIGLFHKKVRQLEHTSEFSGEYIVYWGTLVKIMDEFWENPEEEVLMLQLYREIVDQVFNYRSYFKADGVKENEILEVLDHIKERLEDFELIKETKNEEIQNLYTNITDTKNIVKCSYGESSKE